MFRFAEIRERLRLHAVNSKFGEESRSGAGLIHHSDRRSQHVRDAIEPCRPRDRGQHEASRPLIGQLGRRAVLRDADAKAGDERGFGGQRSGSGGPVQVHRLVVQSTEPPVLVRADESFRIRTYSRRGYVHVVSVTRGDGPTFLSSGPMHLLAKTIVR